MTKTKTAKRRKMTTLMTRQIRRLYFGKNARGALEYGTRYIPDPNAKDGERESYDCSEWPLESDLWSPYDLRDAIGKMEVYEGLCLDLYVYLPTGPFSPSREDWELWENICVRFNGTEWERAEYPKQR
jgi:hypothetical protein